MQNNNEQIQDEKVYTYQEMQEAEERAIQKVLDLIKDEKLKEEIRTKLKKKVEKNDTQNKNLQEIKENEDSIKMSNQQIEKLELRMKKHKKTLEVLKYFQQQDEVQSVVQILLELDLENLSLCFIDYDKKYSNGLTLLEYCYYKKYIKILNFAFNTKLKYIYDNKKYLEYCNDGNFAGVYTCIKNEVNLEQKDISFYDYTGLIWASRYGHQSIVDILIDFQVDVNLKSSDQYSALMWAAGNGHLKIVDKLIENEADVNQKLNNQRTTLMIASENGHLEIVEKLVQNGADINQQEDDGDNAFNYACRSKHEKIIQFLLKQGADTSLRYKNQTGLQKLKSSDQSMYDRTLKFINENNIQVNQRDL